MDTGSTNGIAPRVCHIQMPESLIFPKDSGIFCIILYAYTKTFMLDLIFCNSPTVNNF